MLIGYLSAFWLNDSYFHEPGGFFIAWLGFAIGTVSWVLAHLFWRVGRWVRPTSEDQA